MDDRIKVLMSTEGTFPFHYGGVSSWCDILVNNLNKDMDFVLYSVMMNPFVTQKYTLPDNVDVMKVPLWGTEEPCEHLNRPFSQIYLSKKRTVDEVIKREFIPLFLDMMLEIVSYKKNPKKFGETLLKLYDYFQKYEYKKTFKSEITWKAYKEFITNFAKDQSNGIEMPGRYSIIHSLGWVYRFMNILNTPLPKVHVTHSSAAAFCSIPCVLLKIKDNVPFLLTEHGIYLREQYLSLGKRGYSAFLNTFLIRMVHSVVNLSYYYADQVSPVCSYNTRWEKEFGVHDKKIEVIYNGIEPSKFLKGSITRKQTDSIIVTSVARIDPVKDIITLLKAADVVKKYHPQVKFIIYGSVSVQDYYEECLRLKEELKLGDNFIFGGHLSDVSKAYEEADIIVLSSISEAFPYSVIEAMMSGKPVVSTDVGGVKEALGECGVVVPPRQPEEFAKGIIKLVENPELRYNFGQDGRDRALNLFTLKKVQDLYYKSYVKLSVKAHENYVQYKEDNSSNAEVNVVNEKLIIDKALALLEFGYFKESIEQLNIIAKQTKNTIILPYILTKIADAYNKLGQYEKALYELEKVEIMMKVVKMHKSA